MLVLAQNAQAPTAITVRFHSPLFGPDLSTVTAVNASLLRRDGTQTSLAFAIVSATSRELVAQYSMAGGEFTTTGAYYLAPQLTLPGGKVSTDTIPLFIAGPFNCIPVLEADASALATVGIDSLGPVHQTWTSVSATTYTANPFFPWLALDLSANAMAVTLWSALDGDSVVLSDWKNAAATHALTLNAAAGQQVPTGSGTFVSSTTRGTAGFSLRLKFRASDGLWLPW